MHSDFDRPDPKRVAEDFEHSLYVAYKWNDGERVPSAAVIYYHHNTVLRIAEIVSGPWATEGEAQAVAQSVADKWLRDNSSNNWDRPTPKSQ